MKVVLDTNIYISAAILGRVCEDVLETCKFGNIDVFISNDIIDELKDKLTNKFLWKDNQISAFLENILEFCIIVEINENVNFMENDPDDNRILECAVSAACDFIVSGDNHLVKLNSYKRIKILNPAIFLLTVKK